MLLLLELFLILLDGELRVLELAGLVHTWLEFMSDIIEVCCSSMLMLWLGIVVVFPEFVPETMPEELADVTEVCFSRKEFPEYVWSKLRTGT